MAQAAEERREGLRRALRQIGPARLIATAAFLILALAFARFSWQLPLASDAERALYDIRFLAAAERVGQDERIVLVTYNDETLEMLGKRSPLDRAMLAEALGAIDAMGARAIGIDILFDQPQAEDPLLLERLRGMKTPTWLAFASSAGAHNAQQMHYRQEQFLRGFIAAAAVGPVRPASIKLETDWEDGVIRRWARPDPTLPLLLANAMADANPAFRRYDGRIDFRLPENPDVPVFTNLPIEVVAASGDALADIFRGRYVLIGGDINDLDNFETPMSRETGGWMKGLEVHAQMLAQKLDGRMPAPVPGWALWTIALAVVIAGGLSSLL
ncbi:MAG: CHASE2 domain-containing protein [Allosphingosinicella sp.]